MARQWILSAAIAFVLAQNASAQTFCWSESVDNATLGLGVGVSCTHGPPNFFATSNEFWRRYNPRIRGMGADFEVRSVTFGVEDSTPGSTVQPATLRIFRDPTPGNPAPQVHLVLLREEVIDVPHLNGGLITHVFSTPVACDAMGSADLVLQLAIPDGLTGQNRFFFGGNTAGQHSPTYISSSPCGLVEPTDLTSIGFWNSHMIFDVCGAQTSQLSTVYCTAKVNSLG